METNETILTRQTVALDDRRKLGKLKGLRIDCDSRQVSHYIIGSSTTGSDLVLPFESALAVGDTFLTIQSADNVLSTSDTTAVKLLADGYILKDAEVYSKTGNLLGVVSGFEFDAVYGSVTKILLKSKDSFDSESFIFFSPDFVFVDDGDLTAAEIRNGVGAEVDSEIEEPQVALDEIAPEPEVEVVIEPADEPADEPAIEEAPVEEPAIEPAIEPAVEEPAEEPAAIAAEPALEPQPVKAEVSVSTIIEEVATVTETVTDEPAEAVDAQQDSEADELEAILIGTTLNNDVVSEDGAFKVAQGTVIDKELIAQARQHNALLSLVVSIDV